MQHDNIISAMAIRLVEMMVTYPAGSPLISETNVRVLLESNNLTTDQSSNIVFTAFFTTKK